MRHSHKVATISDAIPAGRIKVVIKKKWINKPNRQIHPHDVLNSRRFPLSFFCQSTAAFFSLINYLYRPNISLQPTPAAFNKNTFAFPLRDSGVFLYFLSRYNTYTGIVSRRLVNVNSFYFDFCLGHTLQFSECHLNCLTYNRQMSCNYKSCTHS